MRCTTWPCTTARVDASGRVRCTLGLARGSYVLATVHRAENTDNAQRLATIADALKVIAAKLPVVWPLHPRARGVL